MSKYKYLLTQLEKYGWSLLQGSEDIPSAHCRIQNPLIERIMSIHEALYCHNSLMTIKVSKDSETKKEHLQTAIDGIKLLSDGWSIDTSVSNEVNTWWKQIHDGGRRIPYSPELHEIAERIEPGDYFTKYFESYPDMEWISLGLSTEDKNPEKSIGAHSPLIFYETTSGENNPWPNVPKKHATQYNMSANDHLTFSKETILDLISSLQNLLNSKTLSGHLDKEMSSIETRINTLQSELDSLKQSIYKIRELMKLD